MPFKAYLALAEYWQTSPPVNESVAAYLGIKPKAKQYQTMDDLMELAQTLPGGAVHGG